MRDVAAAAEVSPGLVMHHFGSKAGLREAVDEHVAQTFDAMLDTLTDAELHDALGGGDATSLAEAFLAGFPAGSPLPDYLRRLWLTNDPTGDRVFRRWLAVERTGAGGNGRGGRRPAEQGPAGARRLPSGQRPRAAPARDHSSGDALGFDLRTPAGMAAWASEAIDVYAHGAFRARDQGET